MSSKHIHNPDAHQDRPEIPLAFRAVRGGLWMALRSYWEIAFGFLANLVLTRLLPVEAFGQFAYALFFVELFSVSKKLGLSYAYVQERGESEAVLGTYVGLESLAAVSGVLITLLVVPFLPNSVAPICLVLMATALLGLGGIGGLVLEKDLVLGRTSLIQAAATTLSYGPAIFLALHGGGVWSLVAQVATHRLLIFVAYALIIPQLSRLWKSRQHFDLQLARRFLRLGATVGATSFVGGLTVNLDSFYIGRFVGEGALGYYDRARRTARWPSTLLTNMVSRTSLYTYTRVQGEPAKIRKAVDMVSWAVTVLAFPIAIAIFAAASDMTLLLYGEKWLPSVPYLRILVFVSAGLPLAENLGTLFISIGKPLKNLRVALLHVLVLAVAGLPLTLAWGVLGTTVAAAIAALIRVIVMFFAVTKEVPLRPFRLLVTPAVASAISLALVVALERLMGLGQMSATAGLTIKSALACGAYFLIIFLLQPSATVDRLVYLWRLLRGSAT